MPGKGSDKQTQTKQKNIASLKLRSVLLVLQMLLPFGLYFALEWQSLLGAWMIAGIFTLSMGLLVWLG